MDMSAALSPGSVAVAVDPPNPKVTAFQAQRIRDIQQAYQCGSPKSPTTTIITTTTTASARHSHTGSGQFGVTNHWAPTTSPQSPTTITSGDRDDNQSWITATTTTTQHVGDSTDRTIGSSLRGRRPRTREDIASAFCERPASALAYENDLHRQDFHSTVETTLHASLATMLNSTQQSVFPEMSNLFHHRPTTTTSPKNSPSKNFTLGSAAKAVIGRSESFSCRFDGCTKSFSFANDLLCHENKYHQARGKFVPKIKLSKSPTS